MRLVKLFEEFILGEAAKPPRLNDKQRAANTVKSQVTKKLLGPDSKFRPVINKIFNEFQKEVKKEASKEGVPPASINVDNLTIKKFESTLNEVNTIECDNCDWSWRFQDGGDDMYTCHNCGYDNTPHLGEGVINEQDTYNDYPAAAKANAKKAIKWKEEYGRDEVKAGTPVGWARAHQLAKGENLSADTVARMSAFNRHRKNSKIATEYKDTPWKDRGYVAWLIWGGDAGVDWAINKMKEINKD